MDSLKALLTRDWQESAGINGKLLAIGYGLATISRAASELRLTSESQQDRRGRLTFWKTNAFEKEGAVRESPLHQRTLKSRR